MKESEGKVAMYLREDWIKFRERMQRIVEEMHVEEGNVPAVYATLRPADVGIGHLGGEGELEGGCGRVEGFRFNMDGRYLPMSRDFDYGLDPKALRSELN